MAVLLDTNVLVHAAVRIAPLHSQACELIGRGLKDRGVFCIAPQNLIEFAAVVSRERFVSPAMPQGDVRRIIDLLFKSRTLTKIYPKRATVLRAVQTGAELELKGPRWYDMFLAETMRDAGVEQIVTHDVRHFRQFCFLSVITIEEAARR